MFGGNDACVGDGGGGEGVVCQKVDLPWQSVCGLEDGFEGRGLEERDVDTGDVEEVRKVGRQLVAGKAADMVSDDDALG